MNSNPYTKNFFSSIGHPDDISGDGTEVLKLAINARFIRYFICQQAQVIFYGDYTLQSVSNDTDIADQLTNILSKDSFLSKHFRSVEICWYTDFEIIPAVFFDASELAADTAFNVILGGEANFVFEVPALILPVLLNKYSAVTHHHSGAAMIDVLHRQGLATPDRLFINVNAENVEIAYFDDRGSLRIYNRYDYKAYQDYIYFILLVADEMKIDREEIKALLIGEISQDSQLYEVTYRYFRNVGFIPQPEDIRFSSAFGEYPKHFNYPLYNL